MAWEPEKLLTTRADVTKAALAATVAARDANIAREILERSLADLAVEILNHGLAALNLKLAELQMDQEGNRAGEVADLKKQIDALKKARQTFEDQKAKYHAQGGMTLTR
jgi:hypothetical protein